MKLKEITETSLLTYSRLRSMLFSVESLFIPLIESVVTKSRPRLPIDDPALFLAARNDLDLLLKADVARIQAGLYPPEVLLPEKPWQHFARWPGLFREGVAASKHRLANKTHEFSAASQEHLADKPVYYQRNFHFQPDGYLSEKSAQLYEHQVEILFGGAADPMRRLLLAPMKNHFNQSQGEGLTFLELGAGTGRTTRFVHQAFPKARIVALDLSRPYLEQARKELQGFDRVDFIEGQAEQLPFTDGLFNAVYSTFVFHELPLEVRNQVLDESRRVLKTGGFMAIVDSIQKGDYPPFDNALERFPKDFHEPFYKNYVIHPLQDLMAQHGINPVRTDRGFFAKCVYGHTQALVEAGSN